MKNISEKVLRSFQGTVNYNFNPMEHLNEGEIASTGNGLFILKGNLHKLMDRIDCEVKKLALSVGAEEMTVPSILSFENTKKSQYLDSFKNQALLLTMAGHKDCQGLASPTICYHVFSGLSGKKLAEKQIVTAVGKCTRHEDGDLADLSRLKNFTMREVVCFADEEECQVLVLKVLEKTEKLLQDVFDLSYDIRTANDPFFGKEAKLKKTAQLLSESKLEVHASLPFNGKTTSIASFNNHGTVFYDRFDITKSNGYSCCIGWGYERILFAILSQKGIDFETDYYKKLGI